MNNMLDKFLDDTNINNVKEVQKVQNVQKDQELKEVIQVVNPKKEEVVISVNNNTTIKEDEVGLDSDFSISFMQVEEEQVNRIVDTAGEIKDKVLKYCLGHNISSVPFEAVGLLEQVESINDFDIKKIDGKKICSYNKGILDTTKIENIIIDIRNNIERGKVVNLDLIYEVNLDGRVYKNLALSSYEVNYIASKFKVFKPTLLTSSNPVSIVLKIGV